VLRERKIDFAVVELDPERSRDLEEAHLPVIIGDAT